MLNGGRERWIKSEVRKDFLGKEAQAEIWRELEVNQREERGKNIQERDKNIYKGHWAVLKIRIEGCKFWVTKFTQSTVHNKVIAPMEICTQGLADSVWKLCLNPRIITKELKGLRVSYFLSKKITLPAFYKVI